MTRIRLAAAAALVVASLTASAHAQEPPAWDAIARQCSAEMGRTAAAWPLWAECTVSRAFPNVSRARTQECIRQVEATRWREQKCAMCGDPIGEVVSCVERGPGQ
jgi:hypothetical protein